MERIAKYALGVIGSCIVIFLIIFGMCWYYDGFHIAWNMFFSSSTLSPFMGVVGIYDWIKGIILALFIAFITEVITGHKLSNKKSKLTVEIASFVVTLAGYMILFA